MYTSSSVSILKDFSECNTFIELSMQTILGGGGFLIYFGISRVAYASEDGC